MLIILFYVNRVESAHAQLKRWLGTATGSFHVIFPKIHDLVELQINEIKGQMEKSRTKSMDMTRYLVFSRLNCEVSHYALKLLKEEYETRGEAVGTSADICGCVMRTSCGLPCAHEMGEMAHKRQPLNVDDIHPFWRTLSLEVRGSGYSLSSKRTAREWLEELFTEIMLYPEDEQYFFGSCMYDLLHPESSRLKDPIYRPHKGRKKHNPTKREKSRWEHAEKNAGNVSKFI